MTLSTRLETASPLPTRSCGEDAAKDYEAVRAALAMISADYREQPEVDSVARAVGMTPARLTQLFRNWCGLTPKAFLQAVTLDHARRLLAEDGAPVLDAALDLGLSGPGRLHDLFVTHEAIPPGAYRARGEGLVIRYGFFASPFGRALLMATDWGLCGLAFADPGGETEALDDMTRRWPRAHYVEDREALRPFLGRIFDPAEWQADRPLRVTLIGTDFEVSVWEGLMTIPVGHATTYGRLAGELGKPKAARAVGAAVGRNPLSFVVPCHRVVGKSGQLTGYHWGLTRKRAMLGWEAGVVAG